MKNAAAGEPAAASWSSTQTSAEVCCIEVRSGATTTRAGEASQTQEGEGARSRDVAEAASDLRVLATDLDQETHGAGDQEVIRAGGQLDGELGRLYELLFVNRNAQMARFLGELLADEGIFFVVLGAGHLVGTDGVVEILRRDGYRVTEP